MYSLFLFIYFPNELYFAVWSSLTRKKSEPSPLSGPRLDECVLNSFGNFIVKQKILTNISKKLFNSISGF